MLNPESVDRISGRDAVEIIFSLDGYEAMKIILLKDDAKRLSRMINNVRWKRK